MTASANSSPFLVDPVVAAGSTCTVTVDITAATAGEYVNIARLPLGGGGEVEGFATAGLDAPRKFLTKSFTDDPVVPGGFVTLDFTVTNLDRLSPATDIAFDDPLPAGLTFDLLVSDDCRGVFDTATPGLLEYSDGGPLGPEAVCTISVRLKVPGAASNGTFANTTTGTTATIGGTPVTGNVAGGTVTLEFTITNPEAMSTMSDISFVDVFDSILPTSPSGAPASGFCGAGSMATFTPLFNPAKDAVIPATLTITGASLAAAGMSGDDCTFSIVIDVIASAAGPYTNTTGEITAVLDDFVGPPTLVGPGASADLVVVGAPSLTKQFTDDPVLPAGVVTLQFTLRHEEAALVDAIGVGFTDDLTAAVAGLTATGLPLTGLCGTGNGTMTGTASNTFLTVAGITLAPAEECTFTVSLMVPGAAVPGFHTNTTSDVTALPEPHSSSLTANSRRMTCACSASRCWCQGARWTTSIPIPRHILLRRHREWLHTLLRHPGEWPCPPAQCNGRSGSQLRPTDAR